MARDPIYVRQSTYVRNIESRDRKMEAFEERLRHALARISILEGIDTDDDQE